MTVLLATPPITESIPGTMAGILHPKVSNRFRVLYTVTANQGEDHDQIATAMKFLSMQTVGVSVPMQCYEGAIRSTGPQRKFVDNVNTTGNLDIIIEDDVGHAVARSIKYLLRRADIQIEVQLLDGAESVVEILLYGRCKLQSVQRSSLDYSKSEAIRHTMTFLVGYSQHGVLTPAQSQEL